MKKNVNVARLTIRNQKNQSPIEAIGDLAAHQRGRQRAVPVVHDTCRRPGRLVGTVVLALHLAGERLVLPRLHAAVAGNLERDRGADVAGLELERRGGVCRPLPKSSRTNSR